MLASGAVGPEACDTEAYVEGGPAAVDGNINSSSFGQVLSAAPPRLLQVGAKFSF